MVKKRRGLGKEERNKEERERGEWRRELRVATPFKWIMMVQNSYRKYYETRREEKTVDEKMRNSEIKESAQEIRNVPHLIVVALR